jgi:hypothetical protein
MIDATRTKIRELIREFEATKSKERKFIPDITKIQYSGATFLHSQESQ